MPITTYTSETQKTTHSKRINELLPDLPEGILVQEISSIEGVIFKKEYYAYQLLFRIDYIEYQIINFPGGTSSINTIVSENIALSFLYGVLAGEKNAKDIG